MKFINSDGQQFHQYQQNEQSPLTFSPNTKTNISTCDVGNPGPALGQAQICGGVITTLVCVFLVLLIMTYSSAFYMY